MFKNEYVLKVDIKRKMTAIVPTFVQNDTAILVFKVYDNGKPFDLTNYTRAEVTHKRKDGQVVIGLASIERLGSEDIVKYQYLGNEMSKDGFVDTTLTLFSNNTRVSIQPFQVSIVADIRDAIGAREEFGVLQELITEVYSTQSLIDDKISEIDKAVSDTNQTLEDIANTKQQAELATLNAKDSATNADKKANLADQNATLANNAASNADEKASLAQQAIDATNLATEEAIDATAGTILATSKAIEATTEAKKISDNLKHKGEYHNATQYFKGNEARHNGSTYVAIQDTKNNPPPTPPTSSNLYWELRAQRGVDGTGAVSAVNNKLPDANGNVTLNPSELGMHEHNNIEILDDIKEDAEGNLKYKGNPIGSTQMLLSSSEPASVSPNMFWIVDLGEDDEIAFGQGGLIIGNASMDGTEKIFFDDNI